MTTITQDMRYRLSLLKYAEKFSVTKAAIYEKQSSTVTVGKKLVTATIVIV